MQLLRLEPADFLALDDDLIAVNKPRGWPTQGRAALGGDSVYAAALRYLKVDRLWCVHWLDRVTSGVLLLARSSASAAALSAQFEARTIRKTYLAWVRGVPAATSGRIDLPLTREGGRPRVDHQIGKVAQTRYRVLRSVPFRQTSLDRLAGPGDVDSSGEVETAGAASLVYLRPLTGRTHQLRVHLAAIGHPIVGDPIHGREGAGKEWRDERESEAGRTGAPAEATLDGQRVSRQAGHRHLTQDGKDIAESDANPAALANSTDPDPAKAEPPCLLHAVELRFKHPADGRLVRLRAPSRDGFSLDGPGAQG